MDTIFFNGNIHTMNEEEIVNALAVKDGLVFAIGSNDEILKLKTKETRVIDLENKLMIPGFNDSHLHLFNYGIGKRRISFVGCKSLEEMTQKTKEYIEQNPNEKLVVGRGWNQDFFDKPVFPNRNDLDKICIEKPMVFYRVCGHVAILNTSALDYFEFNENTEVPEGGTLDLSTGILTENALNILVLPEINKDEFKELIKDVGNDLLSYGITSVQSDDFGKVDYHKVTQAFNELADDKELPVRVYQQCIFENYKEIEYFLNEKLEITSNDAYYKHGPIKLLADGSLGGRTAYLREPYYDDPNTKGIACFTQKEMDDIVELCQSKNKALAIHCIGDGTCYQVLESFEKAKVTSNNKVRHGIVHCQINDEVIPIKMSELGLSAYVQPIFLDYDIHIVKERVGEKLAATSYQFKTLKKSGVVISLGSDCPVEFFDPYHNIYCAVSRKDLKGYPKEGYNPNEALSVQEAVYAYTVGSAYCSYEEDVKGKLIPGFYADCCVVDRDIFTVTTEEIKDAETLLTMIDGEVVYQR